MPEKKQKTDNRSVGGRFEQEFAEILAKNGFWAHVMQQNKAGQPSDIIAVKGKFHTLIDGKVVSDNKGFPFDRIEENQRTAMHVFTRKGGELCYFAIRIPDMSIWVISLQKIENLEGYGKKKLTECELKEKAYPLEEWLKASNTWAEEL